MEQHDRNCPRLQFWDAGEFQAPCTCEPTFDEECLAMYGELLTGGHKHFCWEWDGLPIDDTMDEFECCLCYKEDPVENTPTDS
jgi:hypothetical protein